MGNMKKSFVRYIQYTGGLIILFGVVFHLQGQGVVGPEESFMYQSQDWINHGITIAIIGIIVTATSTIIRIRHV